MTVAHAGSWPTDAGLTAQPRSRLKTPAGRRFAVAALIAAVMSTGFTAWLYFQIGGATVTTAVDDFGEAAAALIAAVSCAIATRRTGGRVRAAWALLGLSALSWGIGEVIYSYLEVIKNTVPFPSPADAGFLLAIPLAIAGLLAFPSAPSRLLTRAQALLDGAIVALSLVFVAWGLGLANVYLSSSTNPLGQLIGAAYPVSDIVIIAVLLLVMRRATVEQRGSMALLLAGLASNAVADSAFAYLNASGSYNNLETVLYAGWVIGFLLIALAPWWPAPYVEAQRAEGPIDLWQMSVPWFALLGAGVTALALARSGRGLDPFLSALGGGLGILLVASMVFLHRDSHTQLAMRDRSEARLERRTAVLNQVITHAPLGVARVGVDLRIIDANPRLGSLLHAPERIMVGSRVSDYLSPDEMASLMQKFKPLWDGVDENVEGDSPVLRADGSAVWLHWSVTAVRTRGGRIDYFLAMFEDITAKHEAQETAMANLAGLERLNKLKSEFVSMVSHEFRTALVGIQGFSEVLMSENVSHDEVTSLAGDINKDAERLNRMIGEMLDLDRMEAGKIRLSPRPVDMNTLVCDAVERARVSTDKHSIVTDLDQSLPIVSADQDRLVQVITNLITNAVKYSPDGGEVKITTRSQERAVCVSVLDHGMGIPTEFIGRLFGRYERFESNRSSKVVGTGLGLAICRQIIELHGGKIWVDSKVGEGSNFQFTIPVGAAAGQVA